MAGHHLARCIPAMASLSSAVFISNHKRGNTLLQGGLAPERKQFQRHGRIRDPHNLEGVLLHLSS